MAKASMTITVEELAVLIETPNEKGGLHCYRNVAKDETEMGTELKLLPFFTAVAGLTNRCTPLSFSKAINLSDGASKVEKLGMLQLLWPTWARLSRKKHQC
eukprot:5773436-Amphidinium_carterae.1